MSIVDNSIIQPEKKTPDLTCLECAQTLSYSGTGRRPRYCSSSCRHRAWERRRAAHEGRVGIDVVERFYPTPAPYNQAGVVEWLSKKPGRISRVCGSIPPDPGIESGLVHALNRVRKNNPKAQRLTWLEWRTSALLRDMRDKVRELESTLEYVRHHQSPSSDGMDSPTRSTMTAWLKENPKRLTRLLQAVVATPENEDALIDMLNHLRHTHPELNRLTQRERQANNTIHDLTRTIRHTQPQQ